MKQEKETTSITLPSPLKRRLEQEAQLPQYQSIHGKPNQSKVVQAALEKFFNGNGKAEQTNPTESSIDILKAKCESMLRGIDQPDNEILKEIKEQRSILDTHTKVLRAILEKEFR